MTLDEALKAATRGYKVAPVGKHGYYVYYGEGVGFRRVVLSKHIGFATFWDETFQPTPYDHMRTWEIYDKSLLTIVKNFIKQAFKNKNQKLSSNPA